LKNFFHKNIISILSIIFISTIVIFLNSFPNWLAMKQTPEGMSFTGQASWFDPWDINVYVSAISWGQHHSFLLENTYTSQPNHPIFYYPVYTTIGMVFPKTNPFFLFHAFASAITFLLVGTLAFSTKKILDRRKDSLIAVLIMSLGGGLGFLIHIGQDSIDATMTSITLHSAFQRAHEGVALSAFFLALFGFYFWLEKKQIRWQIAAQISLVISLIFYPYNIAIYFLTTGIYLWITYGQLSFKNREWQTWILTIFLGITAVLGMALNLGENSSFSSVVSQSLSHPSILSFIFGYGLILILFIYQLIFIKNKTRIQTFLSIWVLCSFSLSLIPIGLSRFFLRGLYVPLALLAVFTVRYLSQRYFPKERVAAKNLLLGNLLLLVSMTSIQIFTERIKDIKNENPWYYMSNSERSTLNFIRDELPPDSTILTFYYMGNQIPANTNSRVYFGHLLQTPKAEEKQEKINQFYSGEMSEEEAKKFLVDNNIQYVYAGREEGEVNYPFLKSVFKNDAVNLYEIN